jgi:hypothetical protein
MCSYARRTCHLRTVGTCSQLQRDPTRVNNDVNRVLAQDGNSSVNLASHGHCAGGIYRYLSAQRLVLRTHVPSDT